MIPAICTADIGTCVEQFRRGWVIDKSADETAAADADAGEMVGSGWFAGVKVEREEQRADSDAN
ncbi:hypothetical protein GCM10007901_01990 [Dyella acidisoli]|uniref:Uncharacterized protein n=1 Tax=Dyella acidisoli TaxID=1867834 RepID=A0ABQ5XLG7_9GAMM|nr:hypothetical protein GCM10007901_01990 [Dyella acidisoli]